MVNLFDHPLFHVWLEQEVQDTTASGEDVNESHARIKQASSIEHQRIQHGQSRLDKVTAHSISGTASRLERDTNNKRHAHAPSTMSYGTRTRTPTSSSRGNAAALPVGYKRELDFGLGCGLGQFGAMATTQHGAWPSAREH